MYHVSTNQGRKVAERKYLGEDQAMVGFTISHAEKYVYIGKKGPYLSVAPVGKVSAWKELQGTHP